jgi:hypothetical protein
MRGLTRIRTILLRGALDQRLEEFDRPLGALTTPSMIIQRGLPSFVAMRSSAISDARPAHEPPKFGISVPAANVGDGHRSAAQCL